MQSQGWGRLFPILCKHIHHRSAGNGSRALARTVHPGARSALLSCTVPPGTLAPPGHPTGRRTKRCSQTALKPESSQYVWAHGVPRTRWAYLCWPASNSCNYMLLTQRPLAVSIGCVSFHFLLCCFALSKSCHVQPQRHLHFADEAMERRLPSQGSLTNLLL